MTYSSLIELADYVEYHGKGMRFASGAARERDDHVLATNLNCQAEKLYEWAKDLREAADAFTKLFPDFRKS